MFLVEDQELEQRLEQGGRDNEAEETGGRGTTKRVSSTTYYESGSVTISNSMCKVLSKRLRLILLTSYLFCGCV